MSSYYGPSEYETTCRRCGSQATFSYGSVFCDVCPELTDFQAKFMKEYERMPTKQDEEEMQDGD